MTFSDRLAVAGVSLVAALSTAAFAILLAIMGGGDLSFILASGPWALAFAGVAAVVAFIAGPARAAAWWGVIWGTEDAENHRGLVVAITVAIIIACAWSLLRQGQ